MDKLYVDAILNFAPSPPGKFPVGACGHSTQDSRKEWSYFISILMCLQLIHTFFNLASENLVPDKSS